MTTNTNAAATPECTAPRPTSATTVTIAPVSAAGQSDLRPTRTIDAAAPTSAARAEHRVQPPGVRAAAVQDLDRDDDVDQIERTVGERPRREQ